jgi:glycine dehydrogenase subunit 2
VSEPLIFEKSRPGRMAASLPQPDVPVKPLADLVPERYLRRTPPELPEVSEVQLVRHFTRLSQRNFCVDTHFYPLGSCTMKYNPKVNEKIAGLEGFAHLHPYQPLEDVQGLLQVLYETEEALKEICAMDRFSLQPAAGAHGELLGMMLVKAYHKSNGRSPTRVIVPDTSHGTNPASAAISGFDVEVLPSDAEGMIVAESLAAVMDNNVAAVMSTNPNTLGLFEKDILRIADIVHQHGALLYYDGANLNALMGICKPGDMGFDIVHLNLHKTFATPHGGGGPGAGPVGVKKKLAAFLPVPVVEKTGDRYSLNYDLPNSIGKIRAFYGNISVILKAYAYILALGGEGLARASRAALINANYLLQKLKDEFPAPNGGSCMHEFVLSATNLREYGIRALDVAKALIDRGFHPPTVYFPLTVPEAIMIEPTETETRETLDEFAEAMIAIARQARDDPDSLHESPTKAFSRRLDEVKAARQPQLRWNQTQPKGSSTFG